MLQLPADERVAPAERVASVSVVTGCVSRSTTTRQGVAP